MTITRLCAISLVAGIIAPWVAGAADYPAPPPSTGKEDFGAHIQRTMTLLETSTPEHRNTVRILFYGQSITDQPWTNEVERYLKQKYPHADLQFAKRSIGGFASQLLVQTAEVDLYPFYPDLLVFHVYGAHNTYEDIIRRTRERTAAEVLMWNDHANQWPVANPKQNEEGWWPHMMNDVFLPKFAKDYGCRLADVRSPWVTYLKANQYEPSKLLKDGVHLNEHGNFLLAELIKREFVYRPDLPRDEWQGLAKTYQVGKDVTWKDGKLELPFEGNRVMLIAKHGGKEGVAARVQIDGQSPSTFPGCYTMTRTTIAPGGWFPAIKYVTWNAVPELEDWTAKITQTSDDPKQIKFEVTGSKTGADGSGVTGEKFVSKSGRVVIEPDAWSFDYAQRMSKKTPPVGFAVKWKTLPLHADVYHTPKDGALIYEIVVAQGFPSGKHTLTLTAENAVPDIAAIRIYNPPRKPK